MVFYLTSMQDNFDKTFYRCLWFICPPELPASSGHNVIKRFSSVIYKFL